MNSGRRIIGATIIVDLIAFAAFFAAAAFSHRPELVIPSLALRWELSEALLGFFGWLAGLQFLALAVSIGSSAGKTEDLVQAAILPTVVLSALLSAIALVASPPLEAARSSGLAASASFNASLDASRRSLVSGDLAAARRELEPCLAISGKDPRAMELNERLKSAEAKAQRTVVAAQEREAPAPKDPAAAKDYYLKALAFFD